MENGKCTVAGCGRAHSAKGLCAMHYQRNRKTGSTDAGKFARHGHKWPVESPTHKSWRGMVGRCHNPRDRAFSGYGGKGVAVCERWRESFLNFLADMGERPAGTSIDRIDNARGYEPSNCRWATPIEQSRNRSTVRIATIAGETKSVSEWATQYGVSLKRVRGRLDRGWSIERALSNPKQAGRQ